MSGLSYYQNVFRIARQGMINNDSDFREPKRIRQLLSCLACRTRKLKCDRRSPCKACSKRNDEASCQYSTSRRNDGSRGDEGSRTSEAQIRLQKLEEMVTGLMQDAKQISQEVVHDKSPLQDPFTPRSIVSHVHDSNHTQPSSIGYLNTHGSERSYIGATHWANILENIRDIQGFLVPGLEDDDEMSSPIASNCFDLGLDTSEALTLAEACNSLPDRPIVDKLLSVYFNSKYLKNPIIHGMKFLREYNSFWIDPSSVSFLWISILFSMLWMGSQISHANGHDVLVHPRVGLTSPILFKRAGQALVTGKYRKPLPLSVEAVLLYAQCKYMQKEDIDADAWMIMGISTRLAMRMGYHRDPRHLANISPFDGEMRRRTFAILTTFDNLLSFQAGLPPVIPDEECDTEPPGNLFDEDFDENCTVLPPSRPPGDNTPMLYYCCKSQFSKLFKRVVRHALSLRTPLYEDTMKLDSELRAVYFNVPPSLRMKSIGLSFTDQTHLVFHRLNIELSYHKSLCVLHRVYMRNEADEKFAYSRKTCAEAAIRILEYQAELYIATQPGGQLFDDRWMLSSLTLHDFLLAAMITCLDLYKSGNASHISSLQGVLGDVKHKHDLLQLSYEMWLSRSEFSRDARRASSVLAIILSKVARPGIVEALPSSNLGTSQISRPTDLSPSSPFLTTPVSPNLGADTDNYPTWDIDTSDPVNSILAGSNDIDWGAVDQYLLDIHVNVDGNSI